ncbi:MAG: CorA family divalent cation transporter, partial [Pseudomonadota bacterium]|nr:CorA family divalent cation transporter [Pseudomonadota bacterium]
MTVIAAFLYRNGQRVRPLAIDERINCAADKSEFVWIGVADPTVEEMQTLARTYNLHPLAVEDAIKANQLPKVDLYGDQLFVVARTAHLEDETICYGETAL